MTKVRLTKIPSVFQRLILTDEVEISEYIVADEGAAIIVEALSEQETNNVLEYTQGRLGCVVKGDIILGALGRRSALRACSGDIPQKLKVGDILHLICKSGILGEAKGSDPHWGKPLQMKVLGSLVSQGRQVNIKDSAIEWREKLDFSTPIVAVVSTGMDAGKTTAICQVAKHFKAKGQKVAVAKLAGVGGLQDVLKITDFGATPVLSLLDAGLPSTYTNADNTIKAALGILAEINKSNPDLIIVEFGSGLLDAYNVKELLQHPDIRKYILLTIVAAKDLVGVWGAKELLQQYGVFTDVITGLVANNEEINRFIEREFGVIAESNLGEMSKTVKLIEKRYYSCR